MTRKQVADRLGRSLATVRRLEGHLLHPRRDARGVHHFDRGEVERLARDLELRRVSLAPSARSRAAYESYPQPRDDTPCFVCEDLQRQVEVLGGELETQRRAHRLQTEALRADSEQVKAHLRAEIVCLERELGAFVSAVDQAFG